MQDTQTLERLRNYLSTRASVDPARVTPEARLEDIDVDSLVLIDLMFELEEAMNVRVPSLDKNPTTVAELIDLFDALQASQVKTGT